MIQIMNLTALLFLIFCTVYDVRTKQIPLSILLVFGVIIAGLVWINGTLIQQMVWLKLLPGVVFLLIAFITKQAVGYGDGIVILLMGVLLGVRQCISMVFIGLIFCSVISLLILVFGKGSKQTKLPFMPFLLTAWGVILIGK